MSVPFDPSTRNLAHIQTTEEVEAARKAGLPTPPPQLKIEIPANRYDLLCLEGVARALRVFLKKEQAPQYTLYAPEKMQEVFVEASVRFILLVKVRIDIADRSAATVLRFVCSEIGSTDEWPGVRVFHRPSGQTAPKLVSTATICSYRDARSGHN